MREHEPVTQTMKASQVRQEWSKLLNTVFRDRTRVVVEKSGFRWWPLSLLKTSSGSSNWKPSELNGSRCHREQNYWVDFHEVDTTTGRYRGGVLSRFVGNCTVSKISKLSKLLRSYYLFRSKKKTAQKLIEKRVKSQAV